MSKILLYHRVDPIAESRPSSGYSALRGEVSGRFFAVCSGRYYFWVAMVVVIANALPTLAEQVDYEKQIKPIFKARCTACHGVLKQEAGLRLDTGAFARKGGDSGSVIAEKNSASSQIISRVTSTDASERMPQEGEPLTEAQIALLRAWIDQGAVSPPDEQPEKDPREHWAFRPVVRPAVPDVSADRWVRNPIDAFIAAQHKLRGLQPQIEATRPVLVRRLYLDLIGLPPTLEQINDAEADQRDDWFEQLADRLLESPQHGERWARHWMDIWRYSDWWGLGEEMRNSNPHIWHWRDWIVDALNANTPYDEMIRQMLDADELYPNDPSKLRATGFLARQYFIFNRQSWLDETVEHVSKGFLGLTMNCAKCHDHKFDPIKQADYYRMRAFFEPYFVRVDMVPGEPNLTRDAMPRAFDSTQDLPTYLFVRGQESNPDKSKRIEPGVPELFAFKELNIAPVPIPREACEPERRPWVLTGYVNAATAKLTTAQNELVAANDRLAAAIGNQSDKATVESKDDPKVAKSSADSAQSIESARAGVSACESAVALAAAELCSVKSRAEAMKAEWAVADGGGNDTAASEAARRSASKSIAAERTAAVAKAKWTVADTALRLLKAADPQKEMIKAELAKARAALAQTETAAAAPISKEDHFTRLFGAKASATRFLSTTADDPTVPWGDHSTGRRKALVEWITDPRNPLTARVAVNHIWNRHMGTPLAPNVFELGRNGPVPTNPELLDWLAAELIESGWDMKHLHRLIVSSATYRMSSETAGREADVEKDPDNIYWWRRNSIRLEAEAIRDSVLSLTGTLDLTMGGPPVQPANEDDSHRRSLYFFHSNNDRNLFLSTFDGALVTECYRRNQSVVPQQALAMSNSRLVLESAKPIAERITASLAPNRQQDDDTFIRTAFLLLLGNLPDAAELSVSQEALQHWRALPKSAPQDARSYFVWSLLNHNDFVTLR